MLKSQQELEQIKLYPWIVWGLGALFFLSEYVVRIAPTSMIPELVHDLHTDAFELGSLTASFYWAYLIMQIPVGVLVDRFGSRRLLCIMALLSAVGCYLFATAFNLAQAEAARFITGIGAAFAFVGTLKLVSVWFPARRFALLAGITQALGMLGAAIGEGPVSGIVHHLGWRYTIGILGSMFFVFAIFIFVIVRDWPMGYKAEEVPHKGKRVPFWYSLIKVLSNPQTWWASIYGGLIYAPTAAFAGLWGVPFLFHAYHISSTAAGFYISMIFFGWALGGPFIGYVSDRIEQRKPFLYVCPLLCLAILLLIIYVPNLPLMLIGILCFLFGICNTGLVLAYAAAKESNPRPVAGTAMGFANMSSVVIGSLLQPAIGWVLDQMAVEKIPGVFTYTTANYKWALLILPVCLILAFFCAFFMKETFQRNH